MTITTEAGATTPATGRTTTDQLRTYIGWHGGEWTTGRAVAHLNIHPQQARAALVALHTAGLLHRHTRNGRRFFTLNTSKDSR